jgi:hypothetical protein
MSNIGAKHQGYDFSKLIRLDKKGNVIKTPEISALIERMVEIDARCPPYICFSKEYIVNGLRETVASGGLSEIPDYMRNAVERDYLCSILITGGFFEKYCIIVFDVKLDGNKMSISYNATDDTGQELNELDKISYVVESIITLHLLESVVQFELDKLEEGI